MPMWIYFYITPFPKEFMLEFWQNSYIPTDIRYFIFLKQYGNHFAFNVFKDLILRMYFKYIYFT